ncbi:MAG TPA: hypothetical protein PK289_00065 [Bacteroidia bacterium]|nr:hypothetical protein [Bacteroidia bacterium]
MGAFATTSPYGAGEVTGSGTANQVSVWVSASSLGVGTIPFTSSATGYTIGSLVAEPGGILTLTSTTQGFIPPRLTTAQKNAINPAYLVDGMMLYDSDLRAITFYDGSSWAPVYGNAWISGGNSFGAATALGNADNFGFTLITNGTERWRLSAAGNLTNTLTNGTSYFHLKAGTTAASTSLMKFTTGDVLATPEAGAWEFVTDSLYFTITTGAARKTVAFTDAAFGGTGQTAVTTGDLLYGSAANTWSRLASGATAGMFLRSAGASAAPVWSTLILPNSATVGQIVYATSTNTYGGSSGYIIGQGTIGASFTTTSTASIVEGFRVVLNAGYTGAATSFGSQMYNAAAGTGTDLNIGTSFTAPLANIGAIMYSYATTTGYNIGGVYEALGGNLNVGLIGKAITTKNNATNIGLIGVGTNAGTSPIFIGGYFGLNTGDAPTFTSAALIADNGSSTAPIQVWRDNGTVSAQVIDGGLWYFGGTATPTSTVHNGGSTGLKNTTSSAGTLTLDATTTVYVFTGTTTTWTLPAVAGFTDRIYLIKNRGSGAITLNSDSGNTIYTTSAVGTLTINPGESYILSNDGTYYLVM